MRGDSIFKGSELYNRIVRSQILILIAIITRAGLKITVGHRTISDHRLKMSDKLLLTVPVSNAKLERILTKLKPVKINFRCSLSVERLENILRIMEEEGSS